MFWEVSCVSLMAGVHAGDLSQLVSVIVSPLRVRFKFCLCGNESVCVCGCMCVYVRLCVCAFRSGQS